MVARLLISMLGTRKDTENLLDLSLVEDNKESNKHTSLSNSPYSSLLFFSYYTKLTSSLILKFLQCTSHITEEFSSTTSSHLILSINKTVASNSMTSTPSAAVQRFGSALLIRFAGSTLAALLLLVILSHKSYVRETEQQASSPNGLRSLQQQNEAGGEDRYFHHPQQLSVASVNTAVASPVLSEEPSSKEYFVFLQKFPLQNSFKMLFHTEVVVCPRHAFANDAHFLESLDALVLELPPSSFDDIMINKKAKKQIDFAVVAKNQWSAQSDRSCVQLGYGGKYVWSSVDNAYEFCRTACCGSPHTYENTHYSLNSQEAVIKNAIGQEKEVYLYGVSSMSGEDAYRAVCHGHMNAVEEDELPVCISDWTGAEYNALTNNCNTYTSTVLKCVYGMSDSKPDLGVSDMVKVKCPKEKINDKVVRLCAVDTQEYKQYPFPAVTKLRAQHSSFSSNSNK